MSLPEQKTPKLEFRRISLDGKGGILLTLAREETSYSQDRWETATTTMKEFAVTYADFELAITQMKSAIVALKNQFSNLG